MQEISLEFGISRSVIYRYSKQFMPKKNIHTDEQLIEMRKKRKNGASIKQLMEEYNISYGTLYRRLHE